MCAPAEAARRPRARGAGAGLGLSIAKGIVTAHGGRMELEQATQGTCFRITLPVEMPPETTAETVADMTGPAGLARTG
jgi:signal transduction histidine kinase